MNSGQSRKEETPEEGRKRLRTGKPSGWPLTHPSDVTPPRAGNVPNPPRRTAHSLGLWALGGLAFRLSRSTDRSQVGRFLADFEIVETDVHDAARLADSVTG